MLSTKLASCIQSILDQEFTKLSIRTIEYLERDHAWVHMKKRKEKYKRIEQKKQKSIYPVMFMFCYENFKICCKKKTVTPAETQSSLKATIYCTMSLGPNKLNTFVWLQKKPSISPYLCYFLDFFPFFSFTKVKKKISISSRQCIMTSFFLNF